MSPQDTSSYRSKSLVCCSIRLYRRLRASCRLRIAAALAGYVKPNLALALGLILTLILAVFVLGGHAAPKGQPLYVPSNPILYPRANIHTALPETMICITYDVRINATTVTTQTFAVHAMQTGLLTESYSVSGGEICLNPTQALMPGELVQVSATTGTLGTQYGQGPGSPTVWHFRIGAQGGTGVFFDSGQSPGSGSAVALGDLNGDGYLDAFIGNEGANEVWLNDGAGMLASQGQRLGSATSLGVALGDLDGDQDLDAFVANNNEACKVWLNDGAGTFADSGQNLIGSSYQGDCMAAEVALADLDGDSDLDAYTVPGHFNSVWLNDGNGIFSGGGSYVDSGSTGLSLGDVDGDGDIDAFLANGDWGAGGGQPNSVLLNDGRGTFAHSGQRLGMADSSAVALGDLDGDRDLDAFVANINWSGSGTSKVWLNNGAGVFRDSGGDLAGLDSDAVALGDVDGDGDLDAFAGNAGILLNDGRGVFSDSGQNRSGSYSGDVALGDMDNDGDLDALSGAGQLWWNGDLMILPPSNSANILFDQAHSNISLAPEGYNYSSFATSLAIRGYRVDVLTSAVTREALKEQGLFVIPGMNTSDSSPAQYTASEITALQSYVQEGGSLLLICDYGSSPPGRSNAAEREVADAFGVILDADMAVDLTDSLSPSDITFHERNFSNHAIMQGIRSLQSFAGTTMEGVGTPLMVTDPDAYPPNRPVGLAIGYGRGKVVVLGDTNYFGESTESFINYADNKQFGLDIVHWLTPRTIYIPLALQRAR